MRMRDRGSMKIASEIAATLCENGIHRGALMDEEVSCIIAAKLAPIRDALKQIANYGHSDKCDGWYDDKLGATPRYRHH